MALENCILRKNGRRWKVRYAKSCKAALNEILWACVAGIIGGKTYNGVELVSDIVEVNSDNTERQPYTPVY